MTASLKNQRHLISVLVENNPGVLARIVSLFSARGFNIESLNVGETENPRFSRMTITVSGDDQIIEQIRKQLEKLIDTLKVASLTDADCVERDFILVKVKISAPKRAEFKALVDICGAHIVDIGDKHMIVELAAPERRVEAFLTLAAPFGIVETVRAGRIALKRGS